MAESSLRQSSADVKLDRPLPRIGGVMTIFYYESIAPIIPFYEELLGFERVLDHGWVVILQIAEGCRLALVEGEGGSQRAIAGTNKGATLSIETRDLANWHDRLLASGANLTGVGLDMGCDGRTIEFRVLDPGGYTVEFLEWIEPPQERAAQE